MQERLSFAEAHDATVLPRVGQKGGAVDSDGAPIPESLLRRSYGVIIDAPDLIPSPEAHLPGTYIFGGLLARHFGHFLLEGCARLWFAESHPDVPIIWSLGGATDFQQQILRIIGVRNQHVFADRPTSVDTLILPEPGYVIHDFCHAEFVRMMGKVTVEPHGKKVWLSRSALPDERASVQQERGIEARLVRDGWIAFHPELHSIADQARIIGGASHVAGFAGSAFHTLLLAETVHGQVTIFARGKRVNRNFDTIADAKRFPQRIIMPEFGDIEGRGTKTRAKLRDPSVVLDNLICAA